MRAILLILFIAAIAAAHLQIHELKSEQDDLRTSIMGLKLITELQAKAIDEMRPRAEP